MHSESVLFIVSSTCNECLAYAYFINSIQKESSIRHESLSYKNAEKRELSE